MKEEDFIMVSVVCQTYNHEKYISECLQSLVSQKVSFRYEILVHDDASTDNTALVIRQYEKEYPGLIDAIYQTQNQRSMGRKVFSGIQLPRCRGKYIAICEGDDYWIDALKLQKQVELLESNPTAALVHTDVNVLYQESGFYLKFYNRAKKLMNNQFDTSNVPLEYLLDSRYLIKTPTVMMRKTLVDNYLVSDSYKYVVERFSFGDTPMWVFLAANSRLLYMDEVTAVYRRNRGSASNQTDRLKKLYFDLLSVEFKIYCMHEYHLSNRNFSHFAETLYVKRLMSYLSFYPDYKFTYSINERVKKRIARMQSNKLYRYYHRISFRVSDKLFVVVQRTYHKLFAMYNKY